jgi:hypothetical protein
MTADIPNVFIQTDMEQNGNEKVIMKIRGLVIDILVPLNPTLYQGYVSQEGKDKILYVELLKAVYGTLQAALLLYKKLKKDLESIGFIINPYDPCVANRIIRGSQQTVTWHLDDLKSSHIDPEVNNEFHKWLEDMYGDPLVAVVNVKRGKFHEYLAMKLDFSKEGKVKIDMKEYISSMLNEFPEEVVTTKYPWNENLFKVKEDDIKLSNRRKGDIPHIRC